MATAWARENDSMSVIKFTNDEPGDTSNYSMVYLTVEVSNWSYLPAEWVQIRVNPASGDLLQIRQDYGLGARAGQDRVPGGTADERAKPHCGRPVEVKYYIFGHKYTVTSTLTAG